MELTIVFKINGNLGATLQLSLSLSTKLLVVKPKGRRYFCNRSRQYEFLSTGNFTSEGETTSDSQNSENTQNFFHFSFLSEPFVRVQVTFDGYNVLSLRTYVTSYLCQ